MRFRILDLLWLVLVVAVFFGARSAMFDQLFRVWQTPQVISLNSYSRASYVINPRVVKLHFRDIQTVEIVPLAVGCSLVEFATDLEIETYIVNVGRNFRTEVAKIENQDRLEGKLRQLLEEDPSWGIFLPNMKWDGLKRTLQFKDIPEDIPADAANSVRHD